MCENPSFIVTARPSNQKRQEAGKIYFAECLKTLIGRVISEASLLKYILQLHKALAPWEDRAIERLLASAVMNVDETSMRVEKMKHWVHVYSSGDITLKRLHPRRGEDAMDEINIIPRYDGVTVYDCLSSYFSDEKSADALCGSHLTRELGFIINSNDYAWAHNMKWLLKETCAEVRRKRPKSSLQRSTPICRSVTATY